MARAHVIAVLNAAEGLELEEEDLAAARALVSQTQALGLRCGWLDYQALEPPAALTAAVGSGAFRAVQVGGDGSLSFKARKGPPVLMDLVREHFSGCQVVFVVGQALPLGVAVRAERAGAEESLVRLISAEGSLDLTSAEFVRRLRRPRLASGNDR